MASAHQYSILDKFKKGLNLGNICCHLN